MKNLQMPHSYISVSEEEPRSISGGGVLDAMYAAGLNERAHELLHHEYKD